MTPLRKLPEPAPFPALGDLLLSLVNHLDAMVAFWNDDQVCLFANAAYSQWFGKTGPEVVGLTMRQLLGPIYEKNLPFIEAALRGERQEFERSIPTPDGSIRHSLATYLPLAQHGKVLGFFAHVVDVSHLKHLQDELIREKARAEDLATHDFLTGLPNRVLLMQRLATAITDARRGNEMMAVLSFDVDNFKQVNDRFGHIGGDLLLTEIARRASSVLRDSDSVTRLGGDEFLVVATRIATLEQVEAVSRRVLAKVGEPFQIDGQWTSPSISLGVAVYPNHALSPEALIAQSDAALYEAKALGKSRMAWAPAQD